MSLFRRLKELITPLDEERKPRRKKKVTTKKIVRKTATKKKLKPKIKTKLEPKAKKKLKKIVKKLPKEKEIGVITHHFGKISVGIIKLKSALRVGDRIHIKGAHDNFTQTVKSMQINHKDVRQAKKGDEIGIKIPQPVHKNDKVYIPA